MYVYIDESGILTKGQGDFFIVATYVTSDKFAAERCIKNIRQNYLKKQYKECTELKYYNSSPEIVTRVLKCIVKQEIDAYYIAGILSDIYNNPDDTHEKEYADILGKTLTESYFKTSYK